MYLSKFLKNMKYILWITRDNRRIAELARVLDNGQMNMSDWHLKFATGHLVSTGTQIGLPKVS